MKGREKKHTYRIGPVKAGPQVPWVEEYYAHLLNTTFVFYFKEIIKVS